MPPPCATTTHRPQPLRDTDPHDTSGRGRPHRRTGRGNEVDPRVEPRAARPERAAERGCDRPREPRRHDPVLSAQSGDRGAADDAVGRQSGPALEPPHGARQVGAERPVEDARREASPGELELERGDVGPLRALGEHA